MKKTQKKLGNKGFSLVELIVVIAIMAVLVGVLAPTLIRNVEKSRESSDLQTLDSIRGSVTTALSVEAVNDEFQKVTTFPYSAELATIKTATTGFSGKLKDELSEDGVLDASLKSKACKSAKIKVTITSDGKVSVAADGATATKSKIAMVAE